VNFIKKHYEKILLGAVLLFLVVAVALLPLKIASEQSDLEEKRVRLTILPVKQLTSLDLRVALAALDRTKTPVNSVFSDFKHNLFNPVPWRRTPDGGLRKVEKIAEGPSVVEVTKITPLYLSIALDSVGASGSNYLITVTKETEVSPARRRTSRYVGEGGRTDMFTLKKVNGPADKPTSLVLELNDTGERVTITPDRRYQKIDGYGADLKYEVEKRTWAHRRVGNALSFAGDDYTIAAINLIATNQYEVVLSAKSSGKKTTIKYNAAP
jgi:hypothetical protein